MSAAITTYYDSLTDEEKQTNDIWGQFGELQMTDE